MDTALSVMINHSVNMVFCNVARNPWRESLGEAEMDEELNEDLDESHTAQWRRDIDALYNILGESDIFAEEKQRKLGSELKRGTTADAGHD